MARRNHEKAYWETNSLEDHVGLMRDMVRRSLTEGGIQRVTKKVLAGQPDDVEWTLTGRKPVIRQWGKSLSMVNVKPAASSDDPACRLIPVWNFVVNNLKYVPDPEGFDLFKTAEVALLDGQGDCDDSCITLSAMILAGSLGRPYARVISTDGEHWVHVYCVVVLPNGSEVALDPTVNGAVPGWEFPRAKAVRDFPM